MRPTKRQSARSKALACKRLAGALLLASALGACDTDPAPDDDGPADDDAAELTCADTPSCPRAEVGATANDGGSAYGDDVVCVLEALRDYSPGALLELEVGFDLLSDSPVLETIVVRADGSVLRQRSANPNGGDPQIGDVERCTLNSAAYFSDCLDAPASACLDTDNWLTECQADTEATCQ